MPPESHIQRNFIFDHDQSLVDFTITSQAYLAKHQDESFDAIATSSLVIDSSASPNPKILLLQRAASDTHPNEWEPPGGAVDDEDSSILHGAARELFEETGLEAGQIEKLVGEPHFFTSSRGLKIVRFTFLVVVKTGHGVGLTPKLDPKEHQAYVWATEEEARVGRAGDVVLDFTREQVKQTVLLAFESLKTS